MNKHFPSGRTLCLLVFVLMHAVGPVRAQVPKPPPTAPEMTESWEPEPPVVTPGKATPGAFLTASSDAIVLFIGKDLSLWKGKCNVYYKKVLEYGCRKDILLWK